MNDKRLRLIEDRLAIQDLNTAFCDLLDNNRVDELAELFCEDVHYRHGDRVSEGRDAVHALFSRRSSTPRTARHLYSGLSIQFTGADEARGHSVCLTFAKDGLPPIVPAIPYLVADFHDHYRRDPDGKWRILRREIERVFLDPDNTGPVGSQSQS